MTASQLIGLNFCVAEQMQANDKRNLLNLAHNPILKHKNQIFQTMSMSNPPGLSIPIANGVPAIRIANMIFLITTLIINGLSSGAIINGTSMADLSDENPNYLVPANYAFIIWALICLFLAAWGAYQILPQSYNSPAINKGIGYVFLVNSVANCAWIYVFAYRMTSLSVVIHAIVLTTNLTIYLRLKLRFPAKTWIDTLCIHATWSLYTAWILSATLTNLWAASTTLDPYYVEQSIVALVILSVIKIGLSVRFRDPIIVLVGAWTLFANFVLNLDIERLAPTSLALSIILLLFGIVVSALNVYNLVEANKLDK